VWLQYNIYECYVHLLVYIINYNHNPSVVNILEPSLMSHKVVLRVTAERYTCTLSVEAVSKCK